MKVPEGLGKWTWEYPGYWSLAPEDFSDRIITVGDCGIQIHLADMSECLAGWTKDVSIVKFYEDLGEKGFDMYFEQIMYLVLCGENEFHRRFQST